MKSKTRSVYDPLLIGLASAATLIGLLFIFDAGYARSLRDSRGVIPREFIMQLVTLPIALFCGWWAGRVRPQKWLKWSKVLWVVSVFSLILVKAPVIGVAMNGAHRWIRFPGFALQPAEFVKLTCVLYLGGVLANRKAWPAKITPRKNFTHWMDTIFVEKAKRALPLFYVVIAIMLIEIEPDLGTAAVVGATAAVMLLVGGVSWKSLGACAAIGLLGVTVLVMKQPYRIQRFVDHGARWSSDNADDSTYQTVQSEVAMASGGITGVGLGNGRAKHVEPATTTDFIMATIAEETGLFGSWIVLAVMGGLSLRILFLARDVKDRYAKLCLTGVAAWFGVQACVNMMMANAFIPPIGIPMPFISSGGSSLIALWLAVGVCQAMLIPVPVHKGETLAVSDHRWRYRRPHLSSARSRAALR
jgi:cell division protein FtsW